MIIEDNIVKKVFEEPDGIYLFFFVSILKWYIIIVNLI
jgi:hypothetical protein